MDSAGQRCRATAALRDSDARVGYADVPPFKLAQMMAHADDKSSVEYQRLTWDALRKSINGLVNKVSAVPVFIASLALRPRAARLMASQDA